MRRQAFTLIELLVVIAIIGLLLSILIPSLAAIKEYASITNCLANQRSLCIAFKMYADENHDKFCSGYVFQDVAKRNPESWVKAPLAYDAAGNQIYMGDNAGLILEHRLNGIREGAIYPYLENTDMFHCPGDRRLRKGTSQKSGTVITRYQAYRSYGMPDFYGVHGSVNGVPNETNLSNIKGGGAKILFVEDQYDLYYNIDAWSYQPGLQVLWDPLGNYHNKSCTFGFVDGHAENYKWRDERTMIYMSDRDLAETMGFGKNVVFNPHNDDLDWLDRHYPWKTRLKGGQ